MFQTLRNCSLFWHIWLLRNFYSIDGHNANHGKQCLDHHFRYCAQCIWDLQFFRHFDIAVLFYTFWLLRNFYCGDAHHGNYAKQNLHQHFQHSLNCVDQIYSVLKLVEIAVCFAHFDFYEISTPVMATMVTMPNKVYIIIFNIPQTVYITYTTFCKFSKLLFENAVCFAHFGFYEISTPVMRTMLCQT